MGETDYRTEEERKQIISLQAAPICISISGKRKQVSELGKCNHCKKVFKEINGLKMHKKRSIKCIERPCHCKKEEIWLVPTKVDEKPME